MHTYVCPEAGFSQYETVWSNQTKCNLISKDRRISMGDVGERTGVDEDGRSFQGLHESGVYSVFKENYQSTASALNHSNNQCLSQCENAKWENLPNRQLL